MGNSPAAGLIAPGATLGQGFELTVYFRGDPESTGRGREIRQRRGETRAQCMGATVGARPKPVGTSGSCVVPPRGEEPGVHHHPPSATKEGMLWAHRSPGTLLWLCKGPETEKQERQKMPPSGSARGSRKLPQGAGAEAQAGQVRRNRKQSISGKAQQ